MSASTKKSRRDTVRRYLSTSKKPPAEDVTKVLDQWAQTVLANVPRPVRTPTSGATAPGATTTGTTRAPGGSGQTYAPMSSSGPVTVEQMMAALSGQESGGNYDATNTTSGAAGKFQIMPENWGPWATEAGLPANAPMTPANQETVAAFKVGQYMQQFGDDPAKVAQAWYAGPGAVGTNVSGGAGYPDSFTYAQEVMGRLGVSAAPQGPVGGAAYGLGSPFYGLDPSIINALVIGTAAKGAPVELGSGWRPTTEAQKAALPGHPWSSQQYLYEHPEATVAGIVAAPGQSWHESGRAVDTSDYQQLLGMGLPLEGVAGDPGHVQLTGDVGRPDWSTIWKSARISPAMTSPVVNSYIDDTVDPSGNLSVQDALAAQLLPEAEKKKRRQQRNVI